MEILKPLQKIAEEANINIQHWEQNSPTREAWSLKWIRFDVNGRRSPSTSHGDSAVARQSMHRRHRATQAHFPMTSTKIGFELMTDHRFGCQDDSISHLWVKKTT